MDKDIKTYLDKLSNVCQQIYKKIRRAVKRYEFWLLVAFFSGVVLTLGITGAFANEKNIPAEKSFKSQPEQYIRAISASARIAPTTTMSSTVPLVVKKKPSPPAQTSEVSQVPSGDWVAQCKTWFVQAGIAEENWDAALYIIDHESDCSPNAQNPGSTAFGIGQFLNSTWEIPRVRDAGCVKTFDPVEQLRCMQVYVEGRGGWSGSLAHKKAKGWY